VRPASCFNIRLLLPWRAGNGWPCSSVDTDDTGWRLNDAVDNS